MDIEKTKLKVRNIYLPVLEPNFDLSFGETERMRDLYSSSSCQIPGARQVTSPAGQPGHLLIAPNQKMKKNPPRLKGAKPTIRQVEQITNRIKEIRHCLKGPNQISATWSQTED